MNETTVTPADTDSQNPVGRNDGAVVSKDDGLLSKEEAQVTFGVPGNTGRYGYADTGEYVDALEGLQGRKVYEKMRRSDAQVIATLRAVKLPILRTKYYMEPFSDDPQDVEIAKIIEDNLMTGMKSTWHDFLRHALLKLDFGFMVFEDVFELRDGLMMIKDLEPRLPQSIYRWEPETTPDGKAFRIKGITQLDNYGRQYFIPIEKCTVMTNDREGDNWEGISILRAAYKNWYCKNLLVKIDGIKHDRTGVGFPTITMQKGAIRGTEEWDAARKLLENLYANEAMGAILADGQKLEMIGLGSSTSGSDVMGSIKYHDEQMAKSMLAMFLNLGTSETGSRALGQSFVDIFVSAIQFYADENASALTRGPIKKMVDFNWKVKGYPKLCAAPVDEVDAEAVAGLVKVGAITPDDEIQAVLRKNLHLPEKKQSSVASVGAPVPDDGQSPAAPKAPIVASISSKNKQFRKPNPWETIPDLRGIDLELDDKQQSTLTRIRAIRDDQARDIIRQIMEGRKPSKINAPRKLEMFQILMQAYKDEVANGRNQVKTEVQKQKDKGISISHVPVVPTTEIQAAVNKIKRGAKSETMMIGMVEDELSLLIEGASDKLTTQITQIAQEGRRQGLEGYQLESYIVQMTQDQITDASWDRMVAKAVNQGWGDGRYQEAADEKLSLAYYSSILDDNRCSECAATQDEQDALPDGVHALGDPEFDAPNPKCEGGEYCRCINIYVAEV